MGRVVSASSGGAGVGERGQAGAGIKCARAHPCSAAARLTAASGAAGGGAPLLLLLLGSTPSPPLPLLLLAPASAVAAAPPPPRRCCAQCAGCAGLFALAADRRPPTGPLQGVQGRASALAGTVQPRIARWRGLGLVPVRDRSAAVQLECRKDRVGVWRGVVRELSREWVGGRATWPGRAAPPTPIPPASARDSDGASVCSQGSVETKRAARLPRPPRRDGALHLHRGRQCGAAAADGCCCPGRACRG